MEETLTPWVISGKDADGNGRASLFETGTQEEAEALFLKTNPTYFIVNAEEAKMKERK